ncbi:MAG: transcription termination factor NusA [Planctomycetota bacterium]
MTVNSEILRFVDTIHRDRQIDKEVIFKGIELALLSAAQRKLGGEDGEGVEVEIDRESGAIIATVDGEPIAPEELGRIAALSGKQVLYQKIREAERDVLFDEYQPKIGHLLNGTVQEKKGGGALIISLGKAEGFLPRFEQSQAESFNVGDRIKLILKDVVQQPNRVQLLCSRADPDLVRRLFELEIPEVADFVVEIKAISREPGHRTKIAVATYDANVDCVGACVGVKGARIRNIVDELFGEKIDIVRWNESIEVLIVEALRPAEIASLELDFDSKSATVYVKPDQQSLAIGRRGQNVRLASKLTGWDLDITPVSDEDLERMKAEGLESRAQELFSDKARENEQPEADPSKLDSLFQSAEADQREAESVAESAESEKPHDPLAAAIRSHQERDESDDSHALDDALAEAGMQLRGSTEPDAAAAEEPAPAEPAAPARPTGSLESLVGLDSDTIALLTKSGFVTVDSVRLLGEANVAAMDGIGPETAREIFAVINGES